MISRPKQNKHKRDIPTQEKNTAMSAFISASHGGVEKQIPINKLQETLVNYQE